MPVETKSVFIPKKGFIAFVKPPENDEYHYSEGLILTTSENIIRGVVMHESENYAEGDTIIVSPSSVEGVLEIDQVVYIVKTENVLGVLKCEIK